MNTLIIENNGVIPIVGSILKDQFGELKLITKINRLPIENGEIKSILTYEVISILHKRYRPLWVIECDRVKYLTDDVWIKLTPKPTYCNQSEI